MRVAVTAACLLWAGRAHATLGVGTTAAALQSAKVVVIVKITNVGDLMMDGKVTESFRGPKVGTAIKLMQTSTLPIPAEVLYVCDAQDNCAHDADRGGFFVIHLPGNKAPLLLQPGVIERRSLAALTGTQPAHALCVHARLHFIDEPAADAAIEGTFAAADGKGTLKLPGAGELTATLLAGGPTARRGDEVQLGLAGTVLIGAPITRGADGCFVAQVVPDASIARTPAQLAKVLAGTARPVTLAAGKLEVTTKASGIALGTTALRLESGAILAPRGPLFADNVLCDVRDADATGGLRLGCQAKGTAALIWLDFGPLPVTGASSDVAIAVLVADGKPHVVKVGVGAEGKPITPIGSATITHVAD